jgi:hypothetical protein
VVAPLVGEIAILVEGSAPTLVEGSAPTPFLVLAALGGFFLFYSLFAALGFLVGVWGSAREDGLRLWKESATTSTRIWTSRSPESGS